MNTIQSGIFLYIDIRLAKTIYGFQTDFTHLVSFHNNRRIHSLIENNDTVTKNINWNRNTVSTNRLCDNYL